MRIAVISGLHYSHHELGNHAQGFFADIMLLRVVQRLNRWLKPDVVFLLGDLLNKPKPDSKALQQLQSLRSILDQLKMPWIAIPGDNDPAPEIFHQVMPVPPESLDIQGVRFLPFIDRQPECGGAYRSQPDIERMAAARHNYTGAIVTIQHPPLFSPDTAAASSRLDNAGAVIEAMRAAAIKLTISGQRQSGPCLLDEQALKFMTAPALHKPPYQFLCVEIDGDNITLDTHTLANPPIAGLTDFHVHTPYAYCHENMDICKTLKLGRMFGLEHIVFSEHSGQLYYPSSEYWNGKFLEPDAILNPQNMRINDYFEDVAAAAPDHYAIAGLEIDCDYQGQPVIRPQDRSLARAPIGAIHFISDLRRPNPDLVKIQNAFMRMVTEFIRCGIVSLAHPLRLFNKAKLPTPTAIFEPLAELLRQNNVAAELNFHINQPSPEFFKICLARGVKITFGSDAHNLYEVGEFYPHLQFLRHDCGYDGDLNDILLNFDQAQNRI